MTGSAAKRTGNLAQTDKFEDLSAPVSSYLAPGTPAFERSSIEVSEYIADMAKELAVMARNKNLDLVASILEIARLEASTTARRIAGNANRR